MNIDISNLKLGLSNIVEINDTITIPDELINKTEIRKLSEINVKGSIVKLSDEDYNININILGTMTLGCAVSLEDVDYKFNIFIDQDFNELEENEEYLKINGNILDIMPIIWENIILEIPIRIVKKDKKIDITGEGWELVEEEKILNDMDPRLEELNKLLDTEEK